MIGALGGSQLLPKAFFLFCYDSGNRGANGLFLVGLNRCNLNNLLDNGAYFPGN